MLGWLVFNNEGEIVKGVPANTTATRKASPFKTHFTVIFRKSYRSDQSDASDGCQISLYIFIIQPPPRLLYDTQTASYHTGSDHMCPTWRKNLWGHSKYAVLKKLHIFKKIISIWGGITWAYRITIRGVANVFWGKIEVEFFVV
jgi:hypothetical protein